METKLSLEPNVVLYKYQTELKASELSTQLGHFSSQGLCNILFMSSGNKILIKELSLLINPKSDLSNQKDSLIKVTAYELNIDNFNSYEDNPFLIYEYETSIDSSYKGDFKFVDEDYVKNDKNKFVLVGSIVKDDDVFSFTSNGADWSDVGLVEKGLNPLRWLSLSSPRRKGNDFTNYVEVRCHNDLLESKIINNDGQAELTSTCDYRNENLVHYYLNKDGELKPTTNGNDINGVYVGTIDGTKSTDAKFVELMIPKDNIHVIREDDSDKILFIKNTIYLVSKYESQTERDSDISEK